MSILMELIELIKPKKGFNPRKTGYGRVVTLGGKRVSGGKRSVQTQLKLDVSFAGYIKLIPH